MFPQQLPEDYNLAHQRTLWKFWLQVGLKRGLRIQPYFFAVLEEQGEGKLDF